MASAVETEKPTLYSYWRSSCSWRVRIALNLKQIEYNYEPVHLVQNIQMSEEYMQKNPRKLVPALAINGIVLTESMAMLHYLDDSYPTSGSRLFPTDPVAKAKVIQLCETINSGIQPIQNLMVLRKVMGYFDEDEKKKEVKLEWGKHWIDAGFEALEILLQECHGTYCFGNQITAADLCLIPQVYNANRFKVNMSKFPIINSIVVECEKNECFEQAQPENQMDAQ